MARASSIALIATTSLRSSGGNAMAASQSKSAEIRARLNHPIIDSDGHTVEVGPLFFDYMKAVGGAKIADRYQTAMLDTFSDPLWRTRTMDERRERRTLR